jgi:flavin reductase (DIM6/NTAB) family NADH-FMN oxidoreductase RutF
MEGAAVRAQFTGSPILEVAVAWIDCELRHTLELGSHSWFVGEVVDCGAADKGSPPGTGPVQVLRMEDTRMSYGG